MQRRQLRQQLRKSTSGCVVRKRKEHKVATLVLLKREKLSQMTGRVSGSELFVYVFVNNI